jgi:hypothetical protein
VRWVQTRLIDGAHQRFLRFKCNRCGTTDEVTFNGSQPTAEAPQGWRLGPLADAHFCPGCEQSKKGMLPVVH